MHELSVCQNLIAQVNQIAWSNNASRVDKIYLQVGPLSGVEPILLEAAFPLASAGTIAANAQLVIHTNAITIRCNHCQAQSEAEANHLVCGSCGAWQTELLGGNELLLERLEMQTGD